MNIFEAFDGAVLNTLSKHPECDPYKFAETLAIKDFNANYFSREKRGDIANYDRLDYISMISLMALKVGIVYRYYESKYPHQLRFLTYGKECKEFMEAVYDKRIDPISYLITHENLLSIFAKCTASFRYVDDGKLNSLLPSVNMAKGIKIVNESLEKAKTIKNINVRQPIINKCVEEIRDGSQIAKKRSEYALDGELFAVSDVGNDKSRSQQDSVLIMKHPNIPEFKILSVCDGVGGSLCGEWASRFVLSNLSEWFEALNENYFENEEYILKSLNAKMELINQAIYSNREFPGSATTITCTIVGKNKTIVFNLGDSRSYAIKDGELSQLSTDNSIVELMRKKGDITAEDKRFHKRSNIITACLGQSEYYQTGNLISNDSYDMLLLFSDGVSDCLSDDLIKFYSISTPKSEIAKILVDKALTTTSIREYTGPEFYEEIPGGKDNTTAAVYVKGR